MEAEAGVSLRLSETYSHSIAQNGRTQLSSTKTWNWTPGTHIYKDAQQIIRWYYTLTWMVLYEQKPPNRVTNVSKYVEKWYLLCNSCGNGSFPYYLATPGTENMPIKHVYKDSQWSRRRNKYVPADESAFYLYNGVLFNHKKERYMVPRVN